ncbi:hypothetical protein [Oleisolibacter albus]|uniref:hypothetical protein n=1 Tax=Oleisolibacter albus TaxID=2171757 RepID=UPI000DF25592|nr:hypothetical protein [Oleisolibacter albus]
MTRPGRPAASGPDSPATDAPGPDAGTVAATLDSLHQVLAGSTALVAKGEMVDLAGLEQEAREVLDSLLALPGSQARGLLPALDSMLTALDALAAALSAAQAVRDGAAAQTARLRAAAAYRPREEP